MEEKKKSILPDDVITDIEDKKKSILPDDVIMDILLLLPIKSLMRFKYVNKTWLQLLTKDPHFLHQLSNKISMIALRWERREHKTCIKSVVELTACGKVELELPFCRGTRTSKSYEICGICRGLIWVSLTYENIKSMYLWNQLTNDYIQIPSPPPLRIHNSETCDKSTTNFGFCYLEDTNQYKAISISQCKHLTSDEYRRSHVSVYTLGTNSSWRNLGSIIYHYFIMDCVAPLVNGALHWIAYTGRASLDTETIVSFDTKDEVFQEIPHPANLKYKACCNGNVGVIGGLLCILCRMHIEDEFVQVWVMLEYGVASSWTKQFTIGRQNIHGSFTYLGPIRVAHNGDIIVLKRIETSNYEFILYNPETKSVRKLQGFGCNFYDAYTYTHSLISPSAISGGRCAG